MQVAAAHSPGTGRSCTTGIPQDLRNEPKSRNPECQEGSPGKGTSCQALPPRPLGALEAASSRRGWQYWPRGPARSLGHSEGPWRGPGQITRTAIRLRPPAQLPQWPAADRHPPHRRCPKWGSGLPALRHVLLGTQGPFSKVSTNHGGSSPSVRAPQGPETALAKRGADSCAASLSRRKEGPSGWCSPGTAHTPHSRAVHLLRGRASGPGCSLVGISEDVPKTSLITSFFSKQQTEI